tara:strand:- start:12876 stop:13433 length:558 start_codon:yes stop_codon:yes gene_type:complete
MHDPDEGARFIEELRKHRFPSLRPLQDQIQAELDWQDEAEYVRLKNRKPGHRSNFLRYGVQTKLHWQGFKDTEMEALMEARPFEEPATDWESKEKETKDLRTAVQEVFDSLTEDEEWLYNCLVVVGLSLRFLSRVLNIPKSTLARRRDSLAQKLREGFLEHEVIKEWLFTRSGYREHPHNPEETN